MRAISSEIAVRLENRRFSVAESYRVAEFGLHWEDDRVELLGGEILEGCPLLARATPIIA